jgi:hypothetical protein
MAWRSLATTVIEDVLQCKDVDLLIENQRFGCGRIFAPSVEWIFLVIPCANFFKVLKRDFYAPALGVMQQPVPKLWDTVDNVIEVFCIDNGIGVDEIQHSAHPFQGEEGAHGRGLNAQ